MPEPKFPSRTQPSREHASRELPTGHPDHAETPPPVQTATIEPPTNHVPNNATAPPRKPHPESISALKYAMLEAGVQDKFLAGLTEMIERLADRAYEEGWEAANLPRVR